MTRRQRMGKGYLMALMVIFISTVDIATAQESHNHPKGESCPLEEVKQVPGSKIIFEEDSFNFGRIPYNRMVTHNFHFQNVGTSPLLIAQHLSSKPIEGC